MNEELGVLVLNLPYAMFRFIFLHKVGIDYKILQSNGIYNLKRFAHKCTRKEAEQFPQFKFVPLSELEDLK